MKDFKINDIVRVKDTPCPERMQNTPALPDALFKVEDIRDGKLTLSVDGSNAYFIFDAKHFELAETSDQPQNQIDMSYKPIREDDVRFDEEKTRGVLAAMDRLNTKWCQEELERIKSNTYSDTNFDCSNCKLADCDPKTAFLTELSELLRKYDARINLGIRTKDRVCGVVLEVNNEELFYPVKIEDMSNDPAIIYQMPQSNYPLTADNIFDYEKE